MKVVGHRNLYGYTIGLLVNEAYFPRLPGALGNATTFSFPILQRAVRGATGNAVVRHQSDDVRAAYLEAARELECAGVRAITTSCGFTATFQSELAASVNVPVFASSLMLVPLISTMLSSQHRVGVITADARSITQQHWDGVRADPNRVAVAGLEGCPEFEAVVFHDKHELDVDLMEAEVTRVAKGLVDSHPDVRALLLECSLLPPFASKIQETTQLPVFDFTSLVNLVHDSLVRKPFSGYL